MTAVPRIVAVGDNVVDVYRDFDEMYPGGNCANVSVFARRFGAETAYLGQVADDEAGRLIRTALDTEGVDTSALRVLENGRTGSCVIAIHGDERVFLHADLGASVFAPTAEELDSLADSDAAHVGASSDLDEWIPEIARRTRLSYDFATRWNNDRISRVAPYAYLAAFSGSELDADAADSLASRAVEAGATWALVTRGTEGAILADRTRRFRADAVRVDAVDTLGAGDTFISRVLVGLLRQEDPSSALSAAAEAAAETCCHRGAFGHRSAIPPHLRLTRTRAN